MQHMKLPYTSSLYTIYLYRAVVSSSNWWQASRSFGSQRCFPNTCWLGSFSSICCDTDCYSIKHLHRAMHFSVSTAELLPFPSNICICLTLSQTHWGIYLGVLLWLAADLQGHRQSKVFPSTARELFPRRCLWLNWGPYARWGGLPLSHRPSFKHSKLHICSP